MDPPRRESQNQPFQLSFNRILRVDFQGSRVTSDGGLLLVGGLRAVLESEQIFESPWLGYVLIVGTKR